MRLRSAILLFFALLTLSAAERSTAQAVRIVHATEELRDGRYVAHVMITNMTSTAISDWKMTFELNSHVEHIEHVEWTDSLNVLQRLPHEVFGQGWTNTILPGEVVWFTISGLAYNNSVEIPRNLFFNGSSYPVEVAFAPEQPVAQPSDMVISTWIDSYDYTTYKGYIVVQNPTDLLFPALWDLKFSTPHLIVDMENVIWSRSGNEYQVYGHTNTDYIRPHDFALIPFRGTHTGTPSLPTNCRLNGQSCTFVGPDHLIDTPRMNVYMRLAELTDTTWEGYVRLGNPSSTALSSWTLRFNLSTNITEMEGMTWERQGDQYTVTPEWGRGRILERSEYTFKMAGTWSDSLHAPTNCTVNGIPCELKYEIQQDVDIEAGGDGTGSGGGGDDGGGDGGGDDGPPSVTCDGASSSTLLPTLDFRFISAQVSSYVAFIDVINNSGIAIKDWSLEFKLPASMGVDNIVPANWTESGGNYVVTPVEANNCILPGDFVRMNMTGPVNGDLGNPIGCNFNGNLCVFQRGFTTATEEESIPVDAVALLPAYPNPFNPQTRISFEVARSQSVRIELWDALGRLRQTLYDGFAASGVPESVHIDGSTMSSGMYFVRLIPQSGATQTQKIILQK